jgi:amyloid beta precursor protein binding protein 1
MQLVVSYGLVGYLRLQAAQHAIVDAKHDPPLHELRVSRPFPALRAFADSIDLDALSSIDHAHVPFVVLLLKAMDKWKAQHGGAMPSAFADKMAFKQSLLGMAWGPPGHEVNFLEAADSAYRAYAPPLVPEEVAAVLRVAKQHAPQFTAQTEDFWWLARALAEFVETQNDGMLPVTGVVPDMTAATDTYVALQEVYMSKAAEDAAAVQRILQTHLSAAGLLQERISRDQVAAFCKNAYNIAVSTVPIDDGMRVSSD